MSPLAARLTAQASRRAFELFFSQGNPNRPSSAVFPAARGGCAGSLSAYLQEYAALSASAVRTDAF